jgi:hypothetical protein
MRIKKLIFLPILLITLQTVSASVISLRTTVNTDILIGNKTDVKVELENLGDESAYNLQISLINDFFKTDEANIKELTPNNPLKIVLNATLIKTITEGRYPAFVLVDYTDANDYPFSSVSPTYIVYKTQTVSKISGLINGVSLTGKESKKLTLSIRNIDDKEHEVTVKLILPREITTDSEEKTVNIGTKEEKTLEFEVSSLSAISGSNYVVITSMEYEDKGLHYSSVASGTIKIGVESIKKQEFNETNILSYVVLVISIIIILIYLYPKYIKRGKKIEKNK